MYTYANNSLLVYVRQKVNISLKYVCFLLVCFLSTRAGCLYTIINYAHSSHVLTNSPHWHLLLRLSPLDSSRYNIAIIDLIKLGHVTGFGINRTVRRLQHDGQSVG